jgi:hypothetical protein
LITNFGENHGVGQTFVINSGSGSGIPGWRRKIPLLFGEKSLETVCYHLDFKAALKWTRSVCLRAF